MFSVDLGKGERRYSVEVPKDRWGPEWRATRVSYLSLLSLGGLVVVGVVGCHAPRGGKKLIHFWAVGLGGCPHKGRQKLISSRVVCRPLWVLCGRSSGRVGMGGQWRIIPARNGRRTRWHRGRVSGSRCVCIHHMGIGPCRNLQCAGMGGLESHTG